MIIGYYRKGTAGAEKLPEEQSGLKVCLRTWEKSTGSAQKQLLLDFEEDLICVVRQVAKYGTIPGYRLFPTAGEEAAAEKDADNTEDGCA